jgi:superfamily II DNA/RNA helicase
MLKVQILKITSPSNFWIADKDPSAFLKLIHNELSLHMEKNLNFNALKSDELIAVFDLNSKMWYRAQIVKEINSFSKSDTIICFYVDTGDKMSCRRVDCREISDPKLKSLPALAKHCSLYGIKPQSSNIFNRNETNEWKPAGIQFFCDLLKDESKCLLASYNDPNESNQFETRLYIKENDQSLVCVNNLMVVNRFASYCSLEAKRCVEQLENCASNFNELNENHYNLTYMKIYLKASRKAQVEKLLEEDQDLKAEKELCVKPVDANLVQNQRAILSNEFDASKELLTNQPKLKPMKKIGNPLDQCVIDYLFLNGLTQVDDFTSYAWPVVFGGRHMFGLPTEKEYDSNFSLNYLAPLVTLIIDKLELDYNADNRQVSKETGYIKKSMNRAQNGPLLLIICPSCKQAQRIFEILTELMNIFTRIDRNRHKTDMSAESFTPRRVFKPFLIQGGGNDSQYDIPLANGCDILISATPFCILRMIGNMNTNLERLKYIVFEEMHLLLDKYPKQIKALMSHYSNLLKINENQHIAQFCLFSSQWSNKLKSFIDSYLLEPIYIINNRLESSYIGQTCHIVREYNSRLEKTHHLKQIVDSVCSCSKNTIIFTETNKSGDEIYQLLLNLNLPNVQYVNAQTHSVNIKLIETKWRNWDLSKEAANLILVLVQDSIHNINVDNARCIVHYDFPLTKSAFADRLWFMRKHFFDMTNDNEIKEDLASNFQQRLCSFLLYGKSEREYSDSLVNFLKRVGQKEEQIPHELLEMAAKRQEKRELKRTKEPLCPFIKSFGKCMSPGYKSCPYRHLPNAETDKLAMIDQNFAVPREGFVRFKVSHVEDANHCFVNLLEHQDLAREKRVEYSTYLNFDMELQLYFSNRANIQYVESFKKGDLYAIKDTSTSIFKRVCVEDCVEKRGSMVYSLVVKTVDYGAKFIVKSNDLIALPPQFKSLPDQAVEVYFCDIRPLEWDINWSRKSKVFVAEKLSKEKEFFGKIQMSAGRTLWLDPISSYKRLKAVDMIVVDDCIRLELIQNNYGAHYPNHLRDLRDLFAKHNVPVPRVDDEMVKIKLEAMKFCEKLYDFDPSELKNLVSYAFLNVDDCFNEVFVSAVDTPSNFYLQPNNSYESLESLNKDIEVHLKKFNQMKAQNEEEKNKKNEIDFQAYSNKIQLIREKLNKPIVEYLNENKIAIYVLAKNSSASEFNRAKVITYIPKENDSIENDQLLVFFLDYGDYEKVSVNEVYPITKTFLTQLPFQAINCSLNGIKPFVDVDSTPDVHLSTNWSSESGDCFWETTHDKNNNHFMNFASIESFQTDPLENNKKKYSINLSAKNVSLHVNVAERLVKMKHARLDEEKELRVFSFIENSDDTQPIREETTTPLRDFPKLVVERLIRYHLDQIIPIFFYYFK